jgi:hypothetical protein
MDATNERFDVKIAHSDDGRKWSSPVRVNDNGQPADNANPAIAVNQDGILCVAWNDRRNDPKNICFQLYFAASTDGGETFLPNVRLQETSTCPNAPGNWKLIPSVFPMRDAEKKLHQVLSMYGFPIRFPNGGDTQGLVTGPGGAFRLAGINGESGVMQLSWTRIETTRELPATTGRSQPADESLEMDLVVSSPLLDGATRVMSVDVTLVNNLRVPVAGPLTLVLEKMGSSLKGVQVTNSDNHKTEAGAAWEFKITGEGQILAPGGRTESRTLRWSFSELPAELDDYPADMTFKVVRGTAITR